MEHKKFKTYQALELPEIRPTGWLKEQLQIQMNGLTGCLHERWDSVGTYSGWLGGTGENWERGPYYLDGLLPLAYLLEDKKSFGIAEKFIQWTLESQDEEGNFGPIESKLDWWSRVVMLKVLIQYYEITKKENVLAFMHKYFHFQKKELPKRPLTQWGKARGADLIYCIKWLYEKEEDEQLIELIHIIIKQSINWSDVFNDFPYTRPTSYYYNWEKMSQFSWDTITTFMKYQETHIVNVTMGLKYPAMVAWVEHNNKANREQIEAMKTLEKYHGVVSGAINGDEHLSGNSPSQGAELCSIVEYMFSLQVMMEIFGDVTYADQLELLAYNALPATITEDYMGHQYLQQANQVLVTKEKRNWFNNLEDANMFGLEPNFGCCTANMHQGWPKMLKSLWYKEENTLISAVFAPNKLSTVIGGSEVIISVVTNYPSDGEIVYCIEKAASKTVGLKIRKPGWCKEYTIVLNEKKAQYKLEKGYIVLANQIEEGDVIKLQLSMEVEETKWRNNSVGIKRGPLVYALDIQEEWSVYKEINTIKDFEICPTSKWNYALLKEQAYEVEEHHVEGVPFTKAKPPCTIYAKAREAEEWKLENGSAQDVPISPIRSDKKVEKIKLIPYGCSKLRIAQFPYVES